MTATTADRYERAASALGMARASFLANNDQGAIAGAFTAFGMLWGTEPRPTWEEASMVCRELQLEPPARSARTVMELADRILKLRLHVEAETKRMRTEAKAAAPEVLITIELFDDEDDDEDLGPIMLVCPHEGCHAVDDIRQVDQQEAWNNVSYREDDGGGLVISDGSSNDGEDLGYICGSCERPVSFPKELDEARTWV
ncbi:hypothetical protein [Kribbella catacumbae]|uniref:hypothetical protein n=1 Tax=Kribbella catacumbae TaxID=460086 RepID=UPI0003618247|nr:hypothetical protein [Kribbella catacumbae]